MMTSLLLLDVQGLDGLAKSQVTPAALLQDVGENAGGTKRKIAVMRAYCSMRVAGPRRNAFRDAGFEVVEASSSEDTLVRMALDLCELANDETTYEEAVLLSGTADLTSMARFARQQLMGVSVATHPGIPASLTALVDGTLDVDQIGKDKPAATPPATPEPAAKPEESSTPPVKAEPTPDPLAVPPSLKAEPKVEEKPAPVQATGDSETNKKDTTKDMNGGGDPWPSPKTGPVLVASGAAAGAASASTTAKPSTPAPRSTNAASLLKAAPSTTTTPAASSTSSPAATSLSGRSRATPTRIEPSLASTKAQSAAPATAVAEPVKAEPIKVEPVKPAPAPKAVETAKAGPDLDLDAALENELSASLDEALATPSVPEAPVVAPTAAVVTPPPAPKTESKPDSLEADLAADLAAELDLAPEPAVAATPVEAAKDDSDIDALFADMATPGAPAAPEPVAAAPAPAPSADDEVDELLSRLMSDDLGAAPSADAAPLDVVPKR